jgi:hypothetical protein
MKKSILILLPILSIVYWHVFMRFVPPPPLVISRETTYFTDLTKKDGKLVLVPSINAMRHLSAEENGAIENLQMFGVEAVFSDRAEILEFCKLLGIDANLLATPAFKMPLPPANSGSGSKDFGETLEELSRKPWQADSHPEMTALIEANNQAFVLLNSMAEKKGYFLPCLERYPLYNAPMPIGLRPAHPMKLLLVRGMQHLHAQNLKQAWVDFSCVGKAARTLLQSSSIMDCLFGIVSMSSAAQAMTTLLAQPDIDREILLLMVKDLDELMVQDGVKFAIMNEMRFLPLSMFIESEGSMTALSGLDNSAAEYDRFVDLNVFCRKVNERADEFEKILSTEKTSEKVKKLRQWNQTMIEKSSESRSGSSILLKMLWIKYLTPATKKVSAVSDIISDILLHIAAPNYTDILIQQLSLAEKFKLLRIAALVRLRHLETGKYPDSLAELGENGKQHLIDSFSDATLHFSSDGQEIVIYSIGTDLKDDHGKPTNEDSSSGDIVIKIPIK